VGEWYEVNYLPLILLLKRASDQLRGSQFLFRGW